MPSEFRKPVKTVAGRVVYDRKLHPFNKAAVSRITQRFIDDRKGWVEEELLPFFYEISEALLGAIFASFNLPSGLARGVLDFLVRQANKVMYFLFGLGLEYELQQLAYRNFTWLCEPWMSSAQLHALGKRLKDEYV